MVDGRIVGMIQEERLTRRKNQVGFPKRAIEALVKTHLDGDFSAVDRIAEATKSNSPYWTVLDQFSEFTIQDWVRQMHEFWYPYYYGDKARSKDDTEDWYDSYWHQRFLRGEKLNEDHNYDFSFLHRMSGKEAFTYFDRVERREVYKRYFGWTGEIEQIGHHRCHAHHALWAGPLTPEQRADALVLTADSRGDYSNWSASVTEPDGRLRCLARGTDHLVARIYKFTTLILGMKPNEHEHKVMGLAPYGRSRRHIEAAERVFFEALDFRDGKFVSDKPLTDCYFDLKGRLEGHRFDNVAAALQNWTTTVTIAWARHWLQETGRRVLCFSGGLSMNIRANGSLLDLPEVDCLSVPPSGGDESLAAGAVFALWTAEGRAATPMLHAYVGEQAENTDGDWQVMLAREGVDAAGFAIRSGIDAAVAARLLAADCIVARCVGPAEFGARALGNRSILANPSNPDNVRILNDAIKNRDFWMPFAPSVLAEHAERYLDNPKGVGAPFMTIGYATKPAHRREIMAALHAADYSVRPQFVYRETNPEYWRLIEEFRRLTGMPAVLNTSLNLHGEPMNYSIADAVRTLALSELDFLLLPGDRLFYKKRAAVRLNDILGAKADAA